MSSPPSRDVLYTWLTSRLEKPYSEDHRSEIIVTGLTYIALPFAVGYGGGALLFRPIFSRVLPKKLATWKKFVIRLTTPTITGASLLLIFESTWVKKAEVVYKTWQEKEQEIS